MSNFNIVDYKFSDKRLTLHGFGFAFGDPYLNLFTENSNGISEFKITKSDVLALNKHFKIGVIDE